jgi:PKD repeat protein
MPDVEFSADVVSGTCPLIVNFTDESTGSPISYLWDFGDGESSTEENPVHRYGAPGVYTVTLTVSDGTDTHTTTRTDYITVTLDFIGVPRSGVKPLEVAFKL